MFFFSFCFCSSGFFVFFFFCLFNYSSFCSVLFPVFFFFFGIVVAKLATPANCQLQGLVIQNLASIFSPSLGIPRPGIASNRTDYMRFDPTTRSSNPRRQLLGSGALPTELIAAPNFTLQLISSNTIRTGRFSR